MSYDLIWKLNILPACEQVIGHWQVLFVCGLFTVVPTAGLDPLEPPSPPPSGDKQLIFLNVSKLIQFLEKISINIITFIEEI